MMDSIWDQDISDDVVNALVEGSKRAEEREKTHRPTAPMLERELWVGDDRQELVCVGQTYTLNLTINMVAQYRMAFSFPITTTGTTRNYRIWDAGSRGYWIGVTDEDGTVLGAAITSNALDIEVLDAVFLGRPFPTVPSR